MFSPVLFLLMIAVFNNSFCFLHGNASLRDSSSEVWRNVKLCNVFQFLGGSGIFLNGPHEACQKRPPAVKIVFACGVSARPGPKPAKWPLPADFIGPPEPPQRPALPYTARPGRAFTPRPHGILPTSEPEARGQSNLTPERPPCLLGGSAKEPKWRFLPVLIKFLPFTV